MILNLEDENDFEIIKALSMSRIPKINSLSLNYIPQDWEEVREFMEISIESLNEFHFNDESSSNIKSTNYISSLKEVVEKTKSQFSVDCTNFYQSDFENLISFSKHIEKIWFRGCRLPTDYECNFGENMEGWRIKSLDFSWSGSEGNSDWDSYPSRFKNLIEGIANCAPLRKSLKTICIKDWDYSIEDAQSVLDKYRLDAITIIS